MKSPWAILLCKFNDDDREPYPRSFYLDLFTGAGVGKFGMVDFFADMSHGKLDLGESQVFGWWTLDKARADYKSWDTVPGGRNAIIDWARAKATAEGVDLSKFHSVVVCMNVDTDLFGSPYGICCDDGRWVTGFSSMSPCILGQEMGHGYDLNHSRIEGGDDYTDPWDIMSTASTPYMAPHPVLTERDTYGRPVFLVGPGLNAANMAHMDWLDEQRVYSAPDGVPIYTEVALRPLHRRDLPGLLAARVGPYFVEFRMNDRWDAAIPKPCVLIHRLENGISYLLPDHAGNPAMTAGSWFERTPEYTPVGGSLRLEVLSIDPATQIARIGLGRPLPHMHQQWPKEGPYRNPGVAWLEESATVHFANHVLTIPKSSASYSVLKQIAVVENSAAIVNPSLRQAVRVNAIAEMADTARTLLDKARLPSGPERTLISRASVAPKRRRAKGR